MRYPIIVAVVLVLFHFTWADRAYRSEDHALRKSSHWSSWSECSVSCGVGQRTRHCHHSCSHHSNPESEHCDMGKCPKLCNKIDTIRSIAEPLELHSVFDKCDQSLNHALVYNFCNISLGPAVWHRGQKVTDFCSSMNRYTPIGTFPQDIFFRPSDSFTGILIGCFPNKTIQIAAQMCGHEPAIYTVPADHAKYHILPADADSLYTIVQ